MRIWIIAAALVLVSVAPRMARAADDDTVRGFLAVCNAGDQTCMIDVASSVQKAVQSGGSCPNPNLEAAGYPLTMVIHGRRAMPPFGDMMNDAQIAAVVNYLRTHFGNNYTDMVTAQDVSEARH